MGKAIRICQVNFNSTIIDFLTIKALLQQAFVRIPAKIHYTIGVH